MQTLRSIQDRLADAVRAFLSTTGSERTIHAREVAEALVDARVLCTDRDGGVDYQGRSAAYRQFVTTTMDAASVSPADRTTVLSRARYHVSAVLRERYPDVVEELGLIVDDGPARARRRRAEDSRAVAIFTGTDPITSSEDVQRVAALATVAVSRIAGLDEATDAERKAAVRVLDRLSQVAGAASSRVRNAEQ